MTAVTKVALFTIFCCGLTHANAQKPHYQYEAGINTGTFLYQGDLVSSPFGSFKSAAPMLQVFVSKETSPYFAFRANLSVGSLGADESQFSNPSWKQLRNFAFHSPLLELSAVGVFNLYGDNGRESYHTLTPYLLAGVGLSLLNTKADWSRLDTTAFNSKSQALMGLGVDTLHSLPRVLPVIPVGAGLRWNVTPVIAINAEAVTRLSFSDYIDGFSYAANPKHADGYLGLSLGVSFRLGNNSVKCPPAKR